MEDKTCEHGHLRDCPQCLSEEDFRQWLLSLCPIELRPGAQVHVYRAGEVFKLRLGGDTPWGPMGQYFESASDEYLERSGKAAQHIQSIWVHLGKEAARKLIVLAQRILTAVDNASLGDRPKLIRFGHPCSSVPKVDPLIVR